MFDNFKNIHNTLRTHMQLLLSHIYNTVWTHPPINLLYTQYEHAQLLPSCVHNRVWTYTPVTHTLYIVQYEHTCRLPSRVHSTVWTRSPVPLMCPPIPLTSSLTCPLPAFTSYYLCSSCARNQGCCVHGHTGHVTSRIDQTPLLPFRKRDSMNSNGNSSYEF